MDPLETETNVNMLLENIKLHLDDNLSVAKEAISALSAMCINGGEQSQDVIRKCGAITFVFKNVFCNIKDATVKQNALYALGCFLDNNAANKKELTTGPTFNLISSLLSTHQNFVTFLQSLCFFLITLVSGNSQGQTLVRSSKCLEKLCSLYKLYLPKTDKLRHKELWSTIVTTICACIDNPQNDDNQRECSAVFPLTFKSLEENTNSYAIVKTASHFLGLAICNNVHNQERALQCGGIQSLCSVLHRAVNRLKRTPVNFQTALPVLTVLTYIVIDNSFCAEKCAEHRVVVLLLKLLRNNFSVIESNDQLLQILDTLAKCTERSVRNQKQLLENDGVSLLIDLLRLSEDQQVSENIHFILKNCVNSRSMKKTWTPLKRTLSSQFESAIHNGWLDLSFEAASPPHSCTGTYTPRKRAVQSGLDAHLVSSEETMVNEPSIVSSSNMTYLPDMSKLTRDDLRKSVEEIANEYLQRKVAGKGNEASKGDEEKCLNCHGNVKEIQEMAAKDAPCDEDHTPVHHEITNKPEQHLCQRCRGEVISVADKTTPVNEHNVSMAENIMVESALVVNDITEIHGQNAEKLTSPKKSQAMQGKQFANSVTQTYQDLTSTQHEEVPDTVTQIEKPASYETSADRSQDIITRDQVNTRQQKRTEFGDDIFLELSERRNEDSNYTRAELVKITKGSQAKKEKISEKSPFKTPFEEPRYTYHTCRAAVVRKKLMVTPARKWLTEKVARGQHITVPDCSSENEMPLMHSSPRKRLFVDVSQDKHGTQQRCSKSGNQSEKESGERSRKREKPRKEERPQTEDKENTDLPLFAVNRDTEMVEVVCPSPCSSSHSDFERQLLQINKEQVYRAKRRLDFDNQGVCVISKVKKWLDDATSENGREGELPDIANTLDRKKSHTMPRRSVQPHKHSTAGGRDWHFRRHTVDGTREISKQTPVTKAHNESERPSSSKTKGSDTFKRPLPKQELKTRDQYHGETHIAKQNHDINKPTNKDREHKTGDTRLKQTPIPKLRNISNSACKAREDDDHDDVASIIESVREELQGSHSVSRQKKNLTEIFLRPSAILGRPGAGGDASQHRARISRLPVTVGDKRHPKCPGCQSAYELHGPLLNSWNYNIAVETSSHTCPMHRHIRQEERKILRRTANVQLQRSRQYSLRKLVDREDTQQAGRDIYDFPSTVDTRMSSRTHLQRIVTPAASVESPGSLRGPGSLLSRTSQRRHRVEYSEQEVANLLQGVKEMGKFWTEILNTFEFHPSRTAIDLKDKYRRLMAKSDESSIYSRTPSTVPTLPFSMAEDRRLSKGVRLYGYNWKAILNAFNFAGHRNAEQLRNRWRYLHRLN